MAKAQAAPLADEASDGRVRRGARNHDLIVQAVYDLVRGGNSYPSVEEIAERAGVGARTVFRQFQDLETLYRSLSERLQQEILDELEPLRFTQVLADDLRLLVTRRARIFERLLPFRRSGRLARQQSAFLREKGADVNRAFRTALETIVRPHIPAHSADLIEGLDALLSVDVWERLRDPQGLSARRAEQVLLATATALAAAATEKRRR